MLQYQKYDFRLWSKSIMDIIVMKLMFNVTGLSYRYFFHIGTMENLHANSLYNNTVYTVINNTVNTHADRRDN